MKKTTILLLFILLVFLHFSFRANEGIKYNQQQLENYLTEQTQLLVIELDAFEKNPLQKNHKQLLKCRSRYKKIEPFVGYFFSRTEKELNGPPVNEIEEEPGSVSIRPPHGFQVIEELLFEDSKDVKKINAESERMKTVLNSVAKSFTSIHPYDYQVFDALQLQLVRMYTLGTVHYDCPRLKSGLDEASVTLDGIKEVLQNSYGESINNETVFASINSAQNFIRKTTKKSQFDYFVFYRNYVRIIQNDLRLLRTKLVKGNIFRFQAINLTAQSLFEEDAFHTHYFTRLQKKNKNQDLILLGKTLFFDPILSRNNKISCATCHKPSKSFTDGLEKASGMLTGETLLRNTPTLLNAALQRDLFYDARVKLLEEQAESVVQNKKEMHGDFGAVAQKLRNSSEYKKLFLKAYAGTQDTLISRQGILTAIAEFERTLLAMNSRFDKSIRNEKMMLTEPEVRGYNLFMGKARCGQCHFAGLFNGAFPPAFEETEIEVLGVPSSAHPPYMLDADRGRYDVFNTEEYKNAFKTTTVRNTELTAPYMHNGVFTTLKEVVEFYNKGGGEGLKILVPNQTLPPDTLGLTPLEIEDVVSFLKSLTDTSNLVYFTGALPVIETMPELDERKSEEKY